MTQSTPSQQNSLLSSSKIENGWIVGPNSELLFWVPPQLHTAGQVDKVCHLLGGLVTKEATHPKVQFTRETRGMSHGIPPAGKILVRSTKSFLGLCTKDK